ncbi:MAG: SDR family oxidoreductase [Candidatus Sericytochromatia bacterium]
MKKLAVVTGSNKGIGFEICKQLAHKGIEVILTARNDDKGKKAEQELKEQGLDVKYHQLDVSDENSVKNLASFIESNYGKLDILINNAGILKDYEGGVLHGEINDIRETLDTNLFGALLVSRHLVPLMQKQNYGRVINISSGMGQLSDMGGGAIGYRLSKVSLNAMTIILANEVKSYNILVNTMCPGWVKTDMGGAGAHRSVEQGADTAVWLATSDENQKTGRFFRDRKEIAW